jgi:IS30 family transposase
MARYKRLTLSERRIIEHSLDQGTSLKQIGRDLGRSTDTISREIARNSTAKDSGGFGVPFNDCLYRDDCTETWLCEKEGCRRERCSGCALCGSVCKKYEREFCTLLETSPYVCNGCGKRKRCTLSKFVYKAGKAQRIYEETCTESRSGIALSEEELRRMDGIVTPLISNGQSPYHICLNNRAELMISDKTLYKYIALNCFGASSTDLRRKVKMRPRRKKRTIKVERSCRKGRTLEDRAAYLEEHPDTEIVEMDTVIGRKGGGEKVLLTIYFTHSHFMLAFLRDSNTAQSVKDSFDGLYEKLGEKDFGALFPLITTDNGSEFTAPSGIEADADGVMRTRVFFCDPYQSNQKSTCENNHRFIRMILPKGTSMNCLAQSDVDLMMSHINSYARESLGGQTPTAVFARQHRKIKGLLEKLGIRTIHANDVTLKPSLVKKQG